MAIISRKKKIKGCNAFLCRAIKLFLKGHWNYFAFDKDNSGGIIADDLSLILCRSAEEKCELINPYIVDGKYVEASIRYKQQNIDATAWPIAVEGQILTKSNINAVSEKLIDGYMEITGEKEKLKQEAKPSEPAKIEIKERKPGIRYQEGDVKIVEYTDFDGNVLRFIGRLKYDIVAPTDEPILEPCYLISKHKQVVIKNLKYRFRKFGRYDMREYDFFIKAEKYKSKSSIEIIDIKIPYYDMEKYGDKWELREEVKKKMERERLLKEALKKKKNPRAHIISIPMGGKVR